MDYPSYMVDRPHYNRELVPYTTLHLLQLGRSAQLKAPMPRISIISFPHYPPSYQAIRLPTFREFQVPKTCLNQISDNNTPFYQAPEAKGPRRLARGCKLRNQCEAYHLFCGDSSCATMINPRKIGKLVVKGNNEKPVNRIVINAPYIHT
jgi:hypothetical protein